HSLLLHVERPVATDADELADDDQRHEKDGQGDHHFQQRQSAPPGKKGTRLFSAARPLLHVEPHRLTSAAKDFVVTTPVRARNLRITGRPPRAWKAISTSSRVVPSGRNVTRRVHWPGSTLPCGRTASPP